MTSRWDAATPAAIGADDARLPVLADEALRPAIDGLDLWDMWPLADAAGRTVMRGGRQWWFFLAVPRGADPEARHDHARIHLLSHKREGWREGAGWRDHGPSFADGFAPGSREWSGTAVLDEDGVTLRMFFTATGDRHGGPRFRQRLFATTGRFVVDGDEGRCEGWSEPVETMAADGHCYAPADQAEATADGIRGFRDPGFFRDPADGAQYLLFTGSAGTGADSGGARFDGVAGIARQDGDGWRLLPPLIDASGTNNELERPHIVVRDGLYYLFWSTQRRRFAPGIDAPTGLYGMVADRIDGAWRPLNGTGLVAGNPEEAPFQAYCWWVTGEGEVLSFVDYPGVGDPLAGDEAARRARFGGTPAPFFALRFAGDRVTLA